MPGTRVGLKVEEAVFNSALAPEARPGGNVLQPDAVSLGLADRPEVHQKDLVLICCKIIFEAGWKKENIIILGELI